VNFSHYILIDGEPVVEPDLMTWARWFQANAAARVVARTTVADGTVVSTVFLGNDHNFGDGAPILFETLVFRHGSGEGQERYHTRAEAEAGHEQMVDRVREEGTDDGHPAVP